MYIINVLYIQSSLVLRFISISESKQWSLCPNHFKVKTGRQLYHAIWHVL